MWIKRNKETKYHFRQMEVFVVTFRHPFSIYDIISKVLLKQAVRNYASVKILFFTWNQIIRIDNFIKFLLYLQRCSKSHLSKTSITAGTMSLKVHYFKRHNKY